MLTKLLFTSALLAALTGCQSKPETRTETVREAADKTATAVKEEAEAAKVSLNRRLDQLDEQIEKLEAKAKKATAKSKAKMNEQAQEMRADAAKLRARMSTWDDKVESAWRTAKRETEEGLDKTEAAIKKFFDNDKD